jgi:hypothetical protein
MGQREVPRIDPNMPHTDLALEQLKNKCLDNSF